MTIQKFPVARRRLLAPGQVCPRKRYSPLWLAVVLSLVACGQAASAASNGTPTGRASQQAVTASLAPALSTQPATLDAPAASPTIVNAPDSSTPIAQASRAATTFPTPTTAGTAAAATAAATATPTAQVKYQPTLGAFSITPVAGATLVTPNPTAVLPQTVDTSIVNILLIGTDSRVTDPSFRTDTLIVVSINKSAGTVSLLSIPRDLFVYIPTYGMARINRAYQLADSLVFPGGGPALLEQTILYNLGIPVQYYALANFDGFRSVVDTLGGIDLPVNCQVTEYKIKDPALDERVAANYDLYTQPIGVAHMDGALALWFARARPVGGDFFRGYRQRQVLRAIYHKALNANIIPEIPALYVSFRDVVQTDMGLWDVMQFVPLTAKLDESSIRSLNIGPNQVTGWTTPDGEDVLIPKPEALNLVIRDFLDGDATHQVAKPITWVEVSNGAVATANDALAKETLHNEGFGVADGAPVPATDFTTIVDHTTSAKGSPVQRLQSILHVANQHVVSQPDPKSPYPFEVKLGADYNSCPRLDWMDTTSAGSATR